MPKKIYLSEVMMPSQTNPSGNVHGGEFMKMMDSTAYAVARDLETSAPRKEQFEAVLTAKLEDFQIGITVGGKKSTSSKCRRTETSLPTQSIAPGA